MKLDSDSNCHKSYLRYSPKEHWNLSQKLGGKKKLKATEHLPCFRQRISTFLYLTLLHKVDTKLPGTPLSLNTACGCSSYLHDIMEFCNNNMNNNDMNTKKGKCQQGSALCLKKNVGKHPECSCLRRRCLCCKFKDGNQIPLLSVNRNVFWCACLWESPIKKLVNILR